MSTAGRFKLLAAAAVVMTLGLAGCGEDNGANSGEGGGGDSTVTTYTITFNANGGTVSPTSGKTGTDGKLTSLPTPTRSGYTFDGWYTAATGGDSVTLNKVYSANATIYARWTEIGEGGGGDSTVTTYTITFNANGGTVSPTSGKTGTDGKLTSLPTPTRSGYTFDGWYTTATGGDSVTLNKIYSANATIYARWTEIPNGGGGDYTEKGNDIKNYKTVVIGTQKWMAENLDYDVPNVTSDVCYENSADSCAKYGRLYNWEAAMGGASSSSSSPSGVRGICPTGWHLPSDAEWTTLTDFVGSTAGTKLKSPQYWKSYSLVPKGTDDFGFSALPGGRGYSGSFSGAGSNGYWWSSEEYVADRSVYGRSMHYDANNVSWHYDNNKRYLYSVRCVED